MRRVITGSLILLGLIALVLSVKSVSGNDQIVVYVNPASGSRLAEVILASGNLQFSQEVEIRPEVMGRVETIYVAPGDRVAKGDLLLELNPDDHQADVDQAEASLAVRATEIQRMEEVHAELSRRVTRLEQVYRSGHIDDESYRQLLSEAQIARLDLQAARQRYQQEEARVVLTRERLAKTRFHAPMDGLVTQVDVSVGTTVVAGTLNIAGSALMTLVAPESYVANIRVDEADIAGVHLDQEVHVYAAATPSQPVAGTVSNISLVATREAVGRGLYYEVEVELDPAATLFPGMSCRAEIVIEQQYGKVAVPSEAIRQDGEEHYLWVAVNGKAHRRVVVPGLATDTQQIILEGLAEDELVIIGPARALGSLVDGVAVRTGGAQG